MFIELTSTDNKAKKMMLNINHVVGFEPHDDGAAVFIAGLATPIAVVETYDEIVRQLTYFRVNIPLV
jgi:hypothetical protein